MPSAGQIDALVGVRPDYLEAAWDEVEQSWSGMDAYFEASGIGQSAQVALRASLIE
jgi:protein-tyrosine phosphatase